MSWKDEFPLDYEIPGLIEFMVKEGVLQDISWHNDVMPSFSVPDPKREDYGVRLWVDHPVAFERETGGRRFGVVKGPYGSENDFEYDTDDLEDAINAFLRQANAYFDPDKIPDFEGLVREWKQSIR
jgi:hypothetical protein